ALAKCAAIRDPIVPAPSTAAFFSSVCIVFTLPFGPVAKTIPHPYGGPTVENGPEPERSSKRPLRSPRRAAEARLGRHRARLARVGDGGVGALAGRAVRGPGPSELWRSAPSAP